MPSEWDFNFIEPPWNPFSLSVKSNLCGTLIGSIWNPNEILTGYWTWNPRTSMEPLCILYGVPMESQWNPYMVCKWSPNTLNLSSSSVRTSLDVHIIRMCWNLYGMAIQFLWDLYRIHINIDIIHWNPHCIFMASTFMSVASQSILNCFGMSVQPAWNTD